MMIPALLVSSLVNDRTRRAGEVTAEISSHVGGQQTFLGPTLAIPYTIAPLRKDQLPTRGIYLIFPALASGTVSTTTTERHRSLFRVPVFQADLRLESSFDLSGSPSAAPQGAELDWSRAEIIVGVSDPRGALSDASLTAGDKSVTFTPSELASEICFGTNERKRGNILLLGASAENIVKPQATFHVAAALKFSGAERIAILAYGKTTHVSARGDWPNPGFDGAILPASRSTSNHGFTADWSLPFIAREIPAEGELDSFTDLDANAIGLSFVEVAGPYQSVDRSLKYALLIIVLVFLSYFVFEITTGKEVHPAQYLLVGAAQIIFYLLLLSVAERIGFDGSYFLAAAATVALLAFNAVWIFRSRLQGIRAMVIFALLYSLIYFLLRLEDYALLVGAVMSFLAIATAMYFTRGLDWYRSPLPLQPPEPHLRPDSPAGAI
jgi:inner membrane protein